MITYFFTIILVCNYLKLGAENWRYWNSVFNHWSGGVWHVVGGMIATAPIKSAPLLMTRPALVAASYGLCLLNQLTKPSHAPMLASTLQLSLHTHIFISNYPLPLKFHASKLIEFDMCFLSRRYPSIIIILKKTLERLNLK